MDQINQVIIDGKPADEQQRRELVELYRKFDIRATSKPIRHFSWDYAKRRAAELKI